MDSKPMKILIIEDDVKDCNNFINCIKSRNDIGLVAVTDSDIDIVKGVRYDLCLEYLACATSSPMYYANSNLGKFR